jgi:hypothetical protein
LFATFTVPDIILVAAASGFCEEVFFRGVIQSQFGLFGAAAFFAIFHCPSLRHLPYGLWALTAGLFLGGLLTFTHSLWTPILAHSISNLIVLIFMRYPRPEASQATSETTTSNANGETMPKPAIAPKPQPNPPNPEVPKPAGPSDSSPATPAAAEAVVDLALTKDVTPPSEPGASQSSADTK